MGLKNNTPFPALAYESDSAANETFIITLLRIKYAFHPTNQAGFWELRFAKNQGELLGADEFYDDNINHALWAENDYAYFKPKTDIIVNAIAKSPNNEPSKSWTCGVRIKSTDEKQIFLNKWLQVTGARHWKSGLMGWWLSEPEATTRVPIRYENAFGGTVWMKKEGKEDVCLVYSPKNPIGCGLLHFNQQEKLVKAPQIEEIGVPIDNYDPYKKHKLEGFGAIHRSWEDRLKYAGTYDQAWQENQHPLPPHDYNHAFEQAAHPDMMVDNYLQGGERFELFGLLPQQRAHIFELPKCDVMHKFRFNADINLVGALNIDTIFMTLESEDPKDWAVYVSYRSRVKKYDFLNDHEISFNPPKTLKA